MKNPEEKPRNIPIYFATSVHTQHVQDHWSSSTEICLHQPMDILHADLHLFLHDLQQEFTKFSLMYH